MYATASASPKTGDNTNLLARWFALFAAAVGSCSNCKKTVQKGKRQMRLKIWGKGLLKIIWVIFVILLVGLSFPQIYGMKCYSVMSGSMSPDLPVGSAIYVKEKEPEKVEKGEILHLPQNKGEQ